MEHISTIIDKTVKSIPTYYSGIKFRSRLEASYAKSFDDYKIRWAYEPEGYNINGTYYLPDFWMPKIRTFFEVKGPMVPGIGKAKKLNQYFNRDCPDELWWNPHYLVVVGNELGEIKSVWPEDRIIVGLCGMCGDRWFFMESGFYGCRSCGFYDGHRHISENDESIDLQQVSIR
jgi:hypothetical protein